MDFVPGTFFFSFLNASNTSAVSSINLKVDAHICKLMLGKGLCSVLGSNKQPQLELSQLDASRRGKKGPKFSRYKNDGAYRSGQGGGGPAM